MLLQISHSIKCIEIAWSLLLKSVTVHLAQSSVIIKVNLDSPLILNMWPPFYLILKDFDVVQF